ncbi:MAG: hypothetical protein OXG92_09335 [Chloroflexi bacterium]|nr:hypothetical protein [Chloroflexota bacterium]MCY3583151.1 hypothetical protein [Chloroflexota bacterium]MCY3716650.1 hypothetical protein [Chloroflexota bacterium]MDE2649402.1 hypothetical protein [Chloroflexota bacterium]MXX84488.1 hypothetical protein [Chloroflexota bacterium]
MDLNCVDRRDVLLAIIEAAAGRGLKRAHLQKAVFLVAEEFKGRLPDDFYEFTKYHFGPYSQTVYRDAEILNDSGCINIKYGADRREDVFSIVKDCGIESIDLPVDVDRFIKESVDWILGMDFQELVWAIYYLYPEYQENSRFEYDEEKAILESFARGLRQSREGKTHSTADVLAQLQEA